MKKNGDKRVLLISRYYYPELLIGAHRAGKFAKYLCEFGWEPVVLSVNERHCSSIDEALRCQIPEDIDVIRTAYFEVETLKRWLLKIGFRRSTANFAYPKFASKKRRYGLANWLEVPSGVGWLPFGLARGLGVAKQCEVILATSPPTAGLCLGALLGKLVRKPFVVDLRDPWHLEVAGPYPSIVHKKVDQWWERFVMQSAARIVVVTPEMKDIYGRKYPEFADKIKVIYNGYDSEDFRGLRIEENGTNSNEEFSIGYFGALDKGREEWMFSFLRAIKTLEQDKRGKKIVIHLRGADPQIFVKLCRSAGVGHLARIGGLVPYREALRMMHQMSILLLVGSPELSHALTGKLFEYIGARKPILAITPEGAISRFVEQHKIGLAVDPEKDEDIIKAMRTLSNKYDFYINQLNKTAEKFTRRAQTEKMSKVLSDAIENNMYGDWGIV